MLQNSCSNVDKQNTILETVFCTKLKWAAFLACIKGFSLLRQKGKLTLVVNFKYFLMLMLLLFSFWYFDSTWQNLVKNIVHGNVKVVT
jgi:hypothetical protein